MLLYKHGRAQSPRGVPQVAVPQIREAEDDSAAEVGDATPTLPSPFFLFS
jgi:hypothetical protein